MDFLMLSQIQNDFRYTSQTTVIFTLKCFIYFLIPLMITFRNQPKAPNIPWLSALHAVGDDTF